MLIFKRPNIAFVAKAGNGKTSAANYLILKYGYYKFSFAEALKKEVMEKYGVSAEEVYETKPVAVRKLLQTYGTNMRERDPNYWIKKCFAKVKRERRNLMRLYDLHLDLKLVGKMISFPVVIDDMRFKNEADECRKRGFKIVRLVRLGDYEVAGINKETAKHVSETEMDGIIADYTIKSPNLVKLYRNLDGLMGELQE